MFISNITNGKCYRYIDPRAATEEHNGFSSTNWQDGEDTYIVCFISEDCDICPMCLANGNNLGDPTDQNASEYLLGLADADIANGDFSGSYFTTYQVSGEPNLRHYCVTMSYNVVNGMVEQVFERID